jgi:hypothetical protein
MKILLITPVNYATILSSITHLKTNKLKRIEIIYQIHKQSLQISRKKKWGIKKTLIRCIMTEVDTENITSNSRKQIQSRVV